MDTDKGAYILGFSTSKYDAWIKFLRDFNFTIAEQPHDGLTPFFEHGRAARVTWGDLEFQVEESDSGHQKASFNLFVTNFPREEIERVKALGHKCQKVIDLHFFTTPDGGRFVV